MKHLFLCIILCLCSVINAQDQLFKKDNTKVEAKILEINQTEIKYKLFTYQDGPTIIISKNDVALIIYQNGVHEVITTKAEEPVIGNTPYVVYNGYPNKYMVNKDSIAKVQFDNLVKTKNLVSFNVIDPINGSISISYIREFAKNYLHAYVPISVGYTEPYYTQTANTVFSGGNSYYYNNSSTNFTISDFKYRIKTYEVGLGLHFQTSGKHAVTHFIGPYVGVSEFKGTYTKYENIFDVNGNHIGSINKTNPFTLNRIYVMLDNGLLFRITPNFNIMMLAGIGYRVDSYKTKDDLSKATNYNNSAFPINAFKFGLNLGYRF